MPLLRGVGGRRNQRRHDSDDEAAIQPKTFMSSVPFGLYPRDYGMGPAEIGQHIANGPPTLLDGS